MADICFVVTCKGRLEFLQQSLPSMVAQPNSRTVVVDYDCPQHTADWVERTYPGVEVLRVADRPEFCKGEAWNLGAAKAVEPWICFTDADIVWHASAVEQILPLLEPRRFARPQSLGQVGVSGTIFCRREDFLQTGGYDEICYGWGYQDSDFLLRLRAMRLEEVIFPAALISHIDHDNQMRNEYSPRATFPGATPEQLVELTWCANMFYCQLRSDIFALAGSLPPRFKLEALYDRVMRHVTSVLRGQPPKPFEIDLSAFVAQKPRNMSIRRKLTYEFEWKTPYI